MSTTTAKITCHNPVTGEVVENVTFQMFYNMQFVDGRKIIYVNGTATFELDDANQVIGVDMLPFRPQTESPIEHGPIDPMTGIALNDVVPGDEGYPTEPGPDAVYPPGAVPADEV
jgi:hypothetical protein